MLFVPGINEYHGVLLEARIMKKLHRLAAINQLQSLLPQFRGEDLRGVNRWEIGVGDIVRRGGWRSCRHEPASPFREKIPRERQPPWRNAVGGDCEQGAEDHHEHRFQQDPFDCGLAAGRQGLNGIVFHLNRPTAWDIPTRRTTPFSTAQTR